MFQVIVGIKRQENGELKIAVGVKPLTKTVRVYTLKNGRKVMVEKVEIK